MSSSDIIQDQILPPERRVAIEPKRIGDVATRSSGMCQGGLDGASGSNGKRQFLDRAAARGVLSISEEREIAKRIEAGVFAQQILNGTVELPYEVSRADLERVSEDGQYAQQRLIEANILFAAKKTKIYVGISELSHEDLIQEAIIGLYDAMEKYDFQKARFSTHAAFYIKKSALLAIANKSRTIRLPVHVHDLHSKLLKAQRVLITKLQREPTVMEIANEAKVKVEKAEEVFELFVDMYRLDQYFGEDRDGEGFIDDVEDTGSILTDVYVEYMSMINELIAIIDSLPDRYAEIIRRIYGIGRAPQRTRQIADALNISKTSVVNIHTRALEQLRQHTRLFEILVEMREVS